MFFRVAMAWVPVAFEVSLFSILRGSLRRVLFPRCKESSVW